MSPCDVKTGRIALWVVMRLTFNTASDYFALMVAELHSRTNELRWIPASYTTEIDVHIGYLQKTVLFLYRQPSSTMGTNTMYHGEIYILGPVFALS